MKKIITALALALTVMTAGAQQQITASMLNAQSLVVSNTICVTNINFSGGRGTNVPSTEWTNLFGAKVVLTATNMSSTNDLSKYNLLVDVPVPVDFAARYGQASISGTNVVQSPYCASIAMRLVGTSGSDTAGTNYVQFLNKDKIPFTDRAFQFAFTPNTTTEVFMMTNLTVSQLFGVSYIRPVYIAAGDVDATSKVIVKAYDVIFWVPQQ
jgi:hypothetical protein